MGQLWCLTKPCFGHFICKVSKVEFANKLLNSKVCFLYHRTHMRSVVFPAFKLVLTFFNFILNVKSYSCSSFSSLLKANVGVTLQGRSAELILSFGSEF